MSQNASDVISLADASPRGMLRGWLTAIGIAVVVYLAVAPTLNWTQFHDPIENLNVATAMEMRHGGPLIVPNLQGYPRLAKPPLTAWLTALSIRPETISALDSRDMAGRTAAYAQFTYEVRRPALLAATLMLIAVYWIGHLCGGARTGTFAALICGSQYIYFRHCHLATTDIQLAMWVATANAFLALCVMRNRRWIGCIGAGVALGFMLMAKGPVGLVQSVLPMTMFALILRWKRPADALPRPSWNKWIAPVIVGALLMVVIGGWWFVWVILQQARTMGFVPAVKFMVDFWFAEVSRDGADTVPPGPWYKHVVSQYLMMPWVLWMIVGAVMAVQAIRNRDLQSPRSPADSSDRGVWPAIGGLMLLAIPLLIMSFAKDRFQRYLIPLSPAAALLSAGALVEYVRGRLNSYWMPIVHWATMLGLAVGLPAAMALGAGKSMQTDEGAPMLSAFHAALLAGAGVALVLVGILLQKRRRDAMIWMTAIIMLGVQAVYYRGLGKNSSGQSELSGAADLIAMQHPDAQIWVLKGRNRNVISVYGNELSIYLNRPVNFSPRTDAVPPADRPQVMLLVRGKKDPELGPIPGWTLFTSFRDGNAKYVLLRLPNSSPTTQP